MAHEVPVTQARAEFADLVNRVVYGGERVVVTRHGKPLAALVSADDLERLEQLDRSEQATIVRLSADPARADSASRQARPQPGHRFGIAAQHRPLGGSGGQDR
jgi:prevent-host-death family protein